MAWDIAMWAERMPRSGRLWVRLSQLLFLMTMFTGTVTVLLYANVVRTSITRLSPETKAGMARDFSLPEKTFENSRPFVATRSWFVVPLIASLIFGSAACLLVAIVVSRRFVRPLEHLTQTAQRIAKGDLSARSPSVAGGGELALLIENVNLMAAQLEHFDAERRASSAAIAHELRTPLAVMRMRVAGLEEGVYPLEAGEVGKLHRQIDVLSLLADDLQTLTLADVDGLDLQPRSLDLSQLTLGLLEDFSARFDSKRLTVTLNSSGISQVRADPERIAQVLNNLLENAFRYTPESHEVKINVRQIKQSVQFTIQNPSHGISGAQVAQLFERFYRSDASRARESGGSGLGLAIVRAIIKAHRGRVWAKTLPADTLEIGFELPNFESQKG